MNERRCQNADVWDQESFPYKVDYCDHFETPLQAYHDIAPFIDVMCSRSDDLRHSQKKSASTTKTSETKNSEKEQSRAMRSGLRVYDPYYCNGRAAVLLQSLGYIPVHEKRDFYKDAQRDEVPSHDILVTNPPFSDQHKKQCLDFCFAQLRHKKRPFAILMPNYVAARQYFRGYIIDASRFAKGKEKEDVVYLLPSTRYEYDHPEGTGLVESPFQSMWFLGVGGQHVDRIADFWKQRHATMRSDDQSELVLTLGELTRHEQMSLLFQKRPNPRRRQRKRKANDHEETESNSISRNNEGIEESNRGKNGKSRKNKKSKYRDADGQRKKRRF